MIQRIQTVWLLLSSLILFALFLFPYVSYIDLVGLGKNIYVSGVYSSVNNVATKESTFLMMTIATVVLALVPLFIIFKFRNRKVQLTLILIQVILICLFAIWMFIAANSILNLINQSIGASNIGIGFFLLPVSIVFLGLAVRGIRNDNKLIKSADRLR
ncbi:DUF4293 family protein [Sphingobacterium sp. DK4209]|uniref:DUF4293 family protein n=1 Tax=Sphingobacterium zhuxiongii TaxID=2662364 RepID=A0A5Q0Q858_9SPHI|nr:MULTISPECIES: DUF4293 domain-containing protein [unclassified Sphingobacterium]MVZ67461.1 DUF4293 family protein [Sphingobacterium sp. DK4209]QGA25021.1 DUF4293 family protein [Sphingobacterium sp. dk4302]